LASPPLPQLRRTVRATWIRATWVTTHYPSRVVWSILGGCRPEIMHTTHGYKLGYKAYNYGELYPLSSLELHFQVGIPEWITEPNGDGVKWLDFSSEC
jgi:hypothetical protein